MVRPTELLVVRQGTLQHGHGLVRLPERRALIRLAQRRVREPELPPAEQMTSRRSRVTGSGPTALLTSPLLDEDREGRARRTANHRHRPRPKAADDPRQRRPAPLNRPDSDPGPPPSRTAPRWAGRTGIVRGRETRCLPGTATTVLTAECPWSIVATGDLYAPPRAFAGCGLPYTDRMVLASRERRLIPM